MDLLSQIKSFDFSKFSWKEATVGPDGKSSAGKFLCFWMGIVLILGTLICFVLLVIKNVSPIVGSDTLTICFAFIGTQFAAILAYLGVNKNLDIKKNSQENDTKD